MGKKRKRNEGLTKSIKRVHQKAIMFHWSGGNLNYSAQDKQRRPFFHLCLIWRLRFGGIESEAYIEIIKAFEEPAHLMRYQNERLNTRLSRKGPRQPVWDTTTHNTFNYDRKSVKQQQWRWMTVETSAKHESRSAINYFSWCLNALNNGRCSSPFSKRTSATICHCVLMEIL